MKICILTWKWNYIAYSGLEQLVVIKMATTVRYESSDLIFPKKLSCQAKAPLNRRFQTISPSLMFPLKQ